MTTQIATLCDYAYEDQEKLNILGTTDRLQMPAFPCQAQSLYFALRIRLGENQQAPTDFDLRITLDEDKSLPLPTIHSKITDRLQQKSYINIVVNLTMMIFPIEGTYRFSYSCGDVSGVLTLAVCKEESDETMSEE